MIKNNLKVRLTKMYIVIKISYINMWENIVSLIFQRSKTRSAHDRTRTPNLFKRQVLEAFIHVMQIHIPTKLSIAVNNMKQSKCTKYSITNTPHLCTRQASGCVWPLLSFTAFLKKGSYQMDMPKAWACAVKDMQRKEDLFMKIHQSWQWNA